jgi:hypothetical protein
MNDQQPEELFDPSKGSPARETPDDDGAAGTGNAPDLEEDHSPEEGNSPVPRFPTASDSPLLEMSAGWPSFREPAIEEEPRYSRASPCNLSQLS